MVEVSVSKDATEPSGERGKVTVRSLRDLKADWVFRSSVNRVCYCESDIYREGNARGEFKSAVALSSVCKM